MLHTRAAAAVAATVVATTLLVAPAGAQTPPLPEPGELPLSVAPTSGHAEDWLTVSGSGCVGPDAVIHLLFFRDPVVPSIAAWGLQSRPAQIVASEDGDWSAEVQLPPETNGSTWTLDPDHEWFLLAECHAGDELLTSVAVPFDLVASPAPTTTSTTTAPVDPAAPTPPPAKPITEEPPFTG